jgi:hypothetical protein
VLPTAAWLTDEQALVIPGAAAESLPARPEGGRLRFTIPRLDAYAQVVIHAA